MRFSFEDYVLDDTRHELWRGEEIVPIEARVFDLLTYLIRNRERVVSQEDLRMAVWEGRVVSISTISSSLNAARNAIGDNGDAQRFIRTVPRKGFRFVASVIEAPTDGSLHASPGPAASTPGPLPPVSPPQPNDARPNRSPDRPPGIAHPNTRRTASIFATGAAAGALAATLAFLFWSLPGAWQGASQPRPAKQFDASVVPLVDDDTRLVLAGYASRPDHKALAIGSAGQFHVADGAQNAEQAQAAALQGCYAKFQRPCQVYASGNDVLWSERTIPLPAPRDVRTESLGIALDPNAIPMISAAERKVIAERLQAKDTSRALALSTGRFYGHHSPTRREAVRIAVERCSFMFGRPCLVLAVDGFLTVQIPKTRRIARTLLPSTDAEIPEAERERIASIYQGREWRALARGDTGSWHAIADAPSEAAAIDAVLKSCRQAGTGCRLHAIGNFVVADE